MDAKEKERADKCRDKWGFGLDRPECLTCRYRPHCESKECKEIVDGMNSSDREGATPPKRRL